MSKLSARLQERLKDHNPGKMAQLVERSSQGALSSFDAIFGSEQLSPGEQQQLQALLDHYQPQEGTAPNDFAQLCQLTGEVKAITKQAILLHGERICKAQMVLKRYREGAFSAWLKQTYGNRQTPYNLLLYYEFYHQLPSSLKVKLELLPKQAIYTLASRKGDLATKIEIINAYAGEPKQQILMLIRQRFPLASSDARRGYHPALVHARQLFNTLRQPGAIPTELATQLAALLKGCLQRLEGRAP